MRTTLDLPADLLVAVKKRAIELHQPLRALVESALRHEMEGRFTQNSQSRSPKKINWVSGSAEAPNFDISSREAMYSWFQENK